MRRFQGVRQTRSGGSKPRRVARASPKVGGGCRQTLSLTEFLSLSNGSKDQYPAPRQRPAASPERPRCGLGAVLAPRAYSRTAAEYPRSRVHLHCGKPLVTVSVFGGGPTRLPGAPRENGSIMCAAAVKMPLQDLAPVSLYEA